MANRRDPATGTAGPVPSSHRVLVSGALAALLSFFVLPALALAVDAEAGSGVKYALVPLLILDPAVILVLSLFAGRRYGVRGLAVLAAALALFLVSTLVVYNSSAMAYALYYLPGGLLGWAVGLVWRAQQRRGGATRAAPRGPADAGARDDGDA